MPDPRRVRRLAATTVLLTVAACATPTRPQGPPSAPGTAAPEEASPLGAATPEDVGMDTPTLVALTRDILAGHAPIFSILISRHGKLVYELYTSSLGRDDAHYLMSATKSVMSALVGIAIDQHLLTGLDESIADALPATLFASPAEVERFRPVTIKDVLGMSALDAPVTPHQKTPEARARSHDFVTSDNRVRFALSQPLLPNPGTDYLYTDVTPALAAGLVAYTAHESVFDFAQRTLFGPLGFRNAEWMHVDPAGLDNGAYGLRLRPIDMQRFGLLFLHHGEWGGRQLLSPAWVDVSFTPWIPSKPGLHEPNYGAYWWTNRYGKGWMAHMAQGWKGQYIAVFPEQDVVVTMTSSFEDGTEGEVFRGIVTHYVKPAVEVGGGAPRRQDKEAAAELARLLEEVKRGPSRIRGDIEPRMVPGAGSKERRKRFGG
jgi:CubicO group peptidase (beta-lactamase class C family)